MIKAPDQIPSSETSIKRASIKRGLNFIYRVASTPDGSDNYGSLLICCFALVGATSRDASLRLLARSRAQVIAVLDNSFEDERATGAIEYCSPLTD